MENNTKILICDENTEERLKIVDYLKKCGYRFIDDASNGDIAVDKISKSDYDIVVVDLWMSRIDGIGIIKSAKKEKHSPAFVLMSAVNKQSILIEASEAGADVCLLKPFEMSTLAEHITSVVRMRSRNSLNDLNENADMESQVTKIIHQDRKSVV